MSKKDITNNEIMEALGQFANSVDKRFVSIEGKFDSIDKKFDSVDKRFDSMDKRFDSIDKHLFVIDGRLDNLENDVSEIKTKVSHIYNILDDHMKRIEAILQENQVQKYQQERMERWIFQLADKMDIKLKYE